MVSDLPITCHFFPQPEQCRLEEKAEKNARKEESMIWTKNHAGPFV